MSCIKVYQEMQLIIKNRCDTILAPLDISFFSFVRLFKNFSYFGIGTYPIEYIAEYKNKVVVPHPQVIKALSIALSGDNKSFVVWSGGVNPKKNEAVEGISAKYGLGSKLTTVRRHQNYYDLCFFVPSLHLGNREVFLAAHKNLLDEFSEFFMRRCSDLIDEVPQNLWDRYVNFKIEDASYQIDDAKIKKFYQSLLKQNEVDQIFSRREIQCLDRIVLGKTYKEIAIELSLSPRSIESYIDRIRSKTGIVYKGEIRDYWAKYIKASLHKS